MDTLLTPLLLFLCVASALSVDLGVGLVICQTKQVFIFDILRGGAKMNIKMIFDPDFHSETSVANANLC